MLKCEWHVKIKNRLIFGVLLQLGFFSKKILTSCSSAAKRDKISNGNKNFLTRNFVSYIIFLWFRKLSILLNKCALNFIPLSMNRSRAGMTILVTFLISAVFSITSKKFESLWVFSTSHSLGWVRLVLVLVLVYFTTLSRLIYSSSSAHLKKVIISLPHFRTFWTLALKIYKSAVHSFVQR